ncbi:hypothetical protein ZHAS_00013635 [Anopheles sinensis]|uniref:Uncharacterized protein n=1 Tax=Anopheles sinensis TaxID=74873 RepID=A0A084W5Z7_ANOSI|nr:hypothetical protein ZHAS_00013635 [Anopheles sinensis]
MPKRPPSRTVGPWTNVHAVTSVLHRGQGVYLISRLLRSAHFPVPVRYATRGMCFD